MCEPTTIAIIASAAATAAQGFQAKQKGKFQNQVAKFNARQSENEAERTRTVGVEEENKARRATAELISRQRAQLGAAGVVVGAGSALQLQEDAATLGEVDALRIRSNFEQRAEALELGAELTRAQGKQAERAGRRQFGISLLAAGGAVLGSGVADKWFSPASAAKQPIASTVSGSQANLAFGGFA